MLISWIFFVLFNQVVFIWNNIKKSPSLHMWLHNRPRLTTVNLRCFDFALVNVFYILKVFLFVYLLFFNEFTNINDPFLGETIFCWCHCQRSCQWRKSSFRLGCSWHTRSAGPEACFGEVRCLHGLKVVTERAERRDKLSACLCFVKSLCWYMVYYHPINMHLSYCLLVSVVLGKTLYWSRSLIMSPKKFL